jgi:hypothetical protein
MFKFLLSSFPLTLPSAPSNHTNSISLAVPQLTMDEATNSKKTPNRNRKTAAVDAKKQANKSRTKENPPNPAADATPATSTGRRHPLGEVTTEANNVEDMAKKMLEMQGKHHPQQSVKGSLTHQRHVTTSGT